MTERSIFINALEPGSPEERVAYLRQACADDAPLRAGVEELLKHHERAGSLLEAPAVADPGSSFRAARGVEGDGDVDGGGAMMAVAFVPEAAGARIGPYKLLEKLGEGGMGVVYMADPGRPVRRRVALKIIKPGTDSARVIARFAERQALAMTDHLNIARSWRPARPSPGGPGQGTDGRRRRGAKPRGSSVTAATSVFPPFPEAAAD